MTGAALLRRRRLRGVALAAIVGLALSAGLAACGDDDDTSSASGSAAGGGAATTSASGGDAGLQEAKQAMADAMKAPAELGLPKWTKPFPTGKTITYVHCGVEVCNTIVDAIKYAADVAGWKLKVIPSNGSPASVKSAWATVVRTHPDAAFGSGFDGTVYAAELAKLKAMKVPVFALATLDKSGAKGIELVKLGPDEVPIVGKQMAAWAVATTEGKANTLYVDLPTFTILKPVMEAYEKSYKELCSSCGYASMNVPITALGSKAPGMIVGYLRSHPDVNVVAMGYDGIGLGLPAALKAAGLADKVKIVGEAPTATNLSYVQAGTQGATVSQGYYEIWANLVDAAARAMTGQSLEPNAAFPPPYWLVTKENVAEANPPKPLNPDLAGELKELWNR